MKDLISVIIPVYNTEKYLHRCIDSVLNQTYQNLEIILVDDGSPDNCPQICDEYAKKDKRVKVIHQENMGQSVARNVALDIITGNYIGFVDSDDWLALDMYEVLLKKIKEAETDLVICGCYVFKNRKQWEKKVDVVKYKNMSDVVNDIVVERIPSLSHVAMKLYCRKVWGDIRFLRGVGAEDNIVAVEFCRRKFSVSVVDGCYYYFNRENENSFTCEKINSGKEYGYFIYLNSFLSLEKDCLTNEKVVTFAKSNILKHAIRAYMMNYVDGRLPPDREKKIVQYINTPSNYEGTDVLKMRYKILCWFFVHCKKLLHLYVRMRY